MQISWRAEYAISFIISSISGLLIYGLSILHIEYAIDWKVVSFILLCIFLISYILIKGDTFKSAGIINVTDANPKLLIDFVASANNNIKMIGISGHVLVEEESKVKPIITDKISKQVEVMLLCLDPHCDYVKQIAMFDTEAEKSIRYDILTSIAKFSTIPGIKVKTYCEPMLWGGLFVDDQRAIIMHFIPNVKKSKFLYLNDGELSMFKSYHKTFNRLWDGGEEYTS